MFVFKYVCNYKYKLVCTGCPTEVTLAVFIIISIITRNFEVKQHYHYHIIILYYTLLCSLIHVSSDYIPIFSSGSFISRIFDTKSEHEQKVAVEMCTC